METGFASLPITYSVCSSGDYFNIPRKICLGKNVTTGRGPRRSMSAVTQKLSDWVLPGKCSSTVKCSVLLPWSFIGINWDSVCLCAPPLLDSAPGKVSVSVIQMDGRVKKNVQGSFCFPNPPQCQHTNLGILSSELWHSARREDITRAFPPGSLGFQNSSSKS